MSTRDMTEKQFQKALARRGWSLQGLWIRIPRTDGRGSTMIIMSDIVMDTKGRIKRRSSLALAIKKYNEALRDLEKKPGCPSCGQRLHSGRCNRREK